jgi:hydroxymethylbilane synthase
MATTIRIGTRESQLAQWQATEVKTLLAQYGYSAELILIKSEGDIDLQTPLYEMGVQGIFTKELDIALLNNKIDIAVHSLKDVPTQPAKGIQQAAVLKRGPVHDLLVFKNNQSAETYSRLTTHDSRFTIATSSIRRKAQWLNKFPNHQIENLRGNVNTRLRKLSEENWNGAIFAQAGLERINLRPANSIVLDWMLPAPAQGAIVVVCREADDYCVNACNQFNDTETYLCTKIERDFLRTLLGGCSTPISALAQVKENEIHFIGNILSVDGKLKKSIEASGSLFDSSDLGTRCAIKLLQQGGQEIADTIRNAG